MSKDQVLSLLPKLKKEELKQVQKLVEQLLNQGEREPSVELWGEAINEMLGIRRGRVAITPAIKNNCISAEAFLSSVMRGKRQVEKAAGRRLLISILISDLKARKLTPSPGIIISNLGRLSEVFDSKHGFPGYREAGMAHVPFERRQT